MLLESRQQPQEELLTSGVKVGQTHTCCIKKAKSLRGKLRAVRDLCALALQICISSVRLTGACVCMQKRGQPVFLKGKSSLFSSGDGRVYWQVGEAPPCGGEPWSKDMW